MSINSLQYFITDPSLHQFRETTAPSTSSFACNKYLNEERARTLDKNPKATVSDKAYLPSQPKLLYNNSGQQVASLTLTNMETYLRQSKIDGERLLACLSNNNYLCRSSANRTAITALVGQALVIPYSEGNLLLSMSQQVKGKLFAQPMNGASVLHALWGASTIATGYHPSY